MEGGVKDGERGEGCGGYTSTIPYTHLLFLEDFYIFSQLQKFQDIC